MSVEIWYLARVRTRDENSNGTPLSMHLVLNENAEVIDLQERGTLTPTQGEPPRRLIEVATQHEGYWKDEDEQGFWEQWVMYPELSDDEDGPAKASIRNLIERSVTISLKRAILADSDRVELYLSPLNDGDERIHLMDLEITRIYKTVFTES